MKVFFSHSLFSFFSLSRARARALALSRSRSLSLSLALSLALSRSRSRSLSLSLSLNRSLPPTHPTPPHPTPTLSLSLFLSKPQQGPGPHRLPLRRRPPRPHQPLSPPPAEGRRRHLPAAQDRARAVLPFNTRAAERVQGVPSFPGRRRDACGMQWRAKAAARALL